MYSIILHMNVLVITVTMNHKLFALPPSISVSHVRWLTRAHYYLKRDQLVYIVDDLSIKISEVVDNGSFELWFFTRPLCPICFDKFKSQSPGWQRGFPWRVMGPKLAAWCVIYYFHNEWHVIFLLLKFPWWLTLFETRSRDIKNRQLWHHLLALPSRSSTSDFLSLPRTQASHVRRRFKGSSYFVPFRYRRFNSSSSLTICTLIFKS